jgi:hypothetical protein
MAPEGIESALATPRQLKCLSEQASAEIPPAPFPRYTAAVISTSRMTPEGR